MTVIAYKDGVMAADRESATTYLKNGRVTKVSVIRGHLVGCAGKSWQLAEWRAWFAAGARPEDFPGSLRGSEDVHVLVVDRDGRIMKFEGGPYPIPREEAFTAIGVGADAATAVMYLGESAIVAVEAASAVCQGCGGGVDSISLHDAAADTA